MSKPRIIIAAADVEVSMGLASLLAPHCEVLGLTEPGAAASERAAQLRPDFLVVAAPEELAAELKGLSDLRREQAEMGIVFVCTHLKASTLSSIFISNVWTCLPNPSLLKAVRAMDGVAGDGRPGADLSKLTSRQIEIVRLTVSGYRAKEIGAKLYISPRTVEWHKEKILSRLRLRTVAELIQFAVSNGLC
jgi:DNA-binding NarL/FixJ family response regulator